MHFFEILEYSQFRILSERAFQNVCSEFLIIVCNTSSSTTKLHLALYWTDIIERSSANALLRPYLNQLLFIILFLLSFEH